MSVAYTQPTTPIGVQPTTPLSRESINALIARRVMGWSEIEPCQTGRIQYGYTVEPLAPITWTCQVCGATGIYDRLQRNNEYVFLPSSADVAHAKLPPDYLADRAVCFDVLARIRSWSQAQRRRFLALLRIELLSCSLVSLSAEEALQLSANEDALFFYVQPAPVCIAALKSLAVLSVEYRYPYAQREREDAHHDK